ncbi:MAG: serine protease, partial [Clostridia bacterium]|nr:serine protease [Clostridia bacterium]
MKNILQLKGQFQQQRNSSNFGPPNLPVNSFVESSHLESLKSQLQRILRFWQENTLIKGALVSVYYKHVVAKSNRIKGLLCKGSSDPNDSIRGSRFDGEEPIKHVFTHYVMLDVLQESIFRLEVCINIVNNEYAGKITQENIEDLNNKRKNYKNIELAKTNFLNVIKDAYYVKKFDIDQDAEGAEDCSIITSYKTDITTKDLLS